MTLLNLVGAETALGGPDDLAYGQVTLEYRAGSARYVEVDGATVILPETITVPIIDGEPEVPLEVQPTRGVCCLSIRISSKSGRSLRRYVAVPDQEAVDFGDLVEVDPATFESLDPLPPNAQQILETAAAAVAETAGAVDDALLAADASAGFADDAEDQSLLAQGFAQDAQEAADSVIPTTSAAVASAITVDGPAKTALSSTIDAGVTAGVAPVSDPAMSLLSWRIALANRDVAPANVVCLGDSITEHAFASALSTRWPNRLAKLLRANAPVAGVVGGDGYISPTVKSGTPLFTWPGTYTGAGTSASAGPKKLVYGLGHPAHNMTYTISGSSIDVIGFRQATGTIQFSVAIDGGAATTYTVPDTLDAVWSQRVSLGSAGAHTVVVSRVAGVVYSFGIVVYNGDENAGIRVHECGWYGSSITTWGSSGRWAADLGMLNPDLIVISMGTNDKGAVNAATFQTNLAAFVDYIRASITRKHSIVLQSYASSNGLSPWADYVQAMRNVAATRSEVVVVDQGKALPRFADDPGNARGLYSSDGIHLADKGHALVAANLAEFLTPRGSIRST